MEADVHQTLSQLQSLRKQFEDSRQEYWDSVVHAMDNMILSQVDLKAKLILALPRPDKADPSQFNSLSLENEWLDGEGSASSNMKTVLDCRLKAERFEDSAWTFLIQHFGTIARDWIRLTTTDKVITEEIEVRSAEHKRRCYESEAALKKLRKELAEMEEELTGEIRWCTAVLSRVKAEEFPAKYAKWTDDFETLSYFSEHITVVQTKIRQILAKREIAKRRAVYNIAAARIQSVQKGRILRRWAKPQLAKRAAVRGIIHRCARGFLGRIKYRAALTAKRQHSAKLISNFGFWFGIHKKGRRMIIRRTLATITLQAFYRGQKGRAKAFERKQQLEHERHLALMEQNEEQKLQAVKDKYRQEELARQSRDAEFQAAIAERQKQKEAEEQAKKDRIQEERKQVELKRYEDRKVREAQEKKAAEEEEKQREKWREEQKKKQERRKELEKLKEGGRKEAAKASMAMQMEERRQENLLKQKEKRKREKEEAARKAEEEHLAYEKKERAKWLNRPWTGDEIEVDNLKIWVEEKYENRAKAFRFMESKMPKFGFTIEAFCDLLCRSIQYCLVWRAQKLFRILDRLHSSKGEITVEDILGGRPSPRQMITEERRWSASSKEVDALAQVPPIVDTLTIDNIMLQFLSWQIQPLSKFQKPDLTVRCAPALVGRDQIMLELEPESGIIKLTAPRGIRYRGVFYVGKTKTLPLEMLFRTDDWKGSSAFNLSIEQTEADQLEDVINVGFVILQNLSMFPDIIDIKKTTDKNKKIVYWRIDNCNKTLLKNYYPRGVCIQSPSFETLGIGPLVIELFPNGSDKCQKLDWCSLRLKAPISSIFHLTFFCGGTRGTPEQQPFRYEFEEGYGLEEFCLFDRIDELTFGIEIESAEEDPDLKNLGIRCEEICDYFLGNGLG